MSRHCFIFIVILFLLTIGLTSGNLKLLQIEDPGASSGEKEKLLFNMNHIREIIAEYSSDTDANIEFADLKDKVLARLGTIKNGKINWKHKEADKDFMAVTFSKEDFSAVVAGIKSNPVRPGFQVILSHSRTNEVLKSYEISARATPDLALDVQYPINVMPGEQLDDKITVTVRNNGSAPVDKLNIDFFLSSEEETPIKLGSFEKNVAGDVTIKEGKELPGQVGPTESLVLQVNEILKIPETTPPGRYYFEARIDPGNLIPEPDEENNIFKGLLIVSISDPKRLTLLLPDTRLVYKPQTFELSIMVGDKVLSDGKDWRKCKLKPYVYQIMHGTWENFHWEIDTSDRSVWRITGAKFCQKGGAAKEIKAAVLVRGGSMTEMPIEVVIKLADTRLEFEPASQKLNILCYGDQIAYTPLWQACKLEPHLYQFKQVDWVEHFWEVNTFKKEVKDISSGGKFCRLGGVASPLQISVNIED